MGAQSDQAKTGALCPCKHVGADLQDDKAANVVSADFPQAKGPLLS